MTNLITPAEITSVTPIVKSFLESYLQNKDSLSLGQWLSQEMAQFLPKAPSDTISGFCSDILSTVQSHEEHQKALEQAMENGRSKEQWFAAQFANAVSGMDPQKAGEQLLSLQSVLHQANNALYSMLESVVDGGSQTSAEAVPLDTMDVQNLNLPQLKAIATNIGSQVIQNSRLGTSLIQLAQPLLSGDPIQGAQLLETALQTGSGTDIKVVLSGAMKVVSELGILDAIPKETTAGTLASIVHVSIEKFKAVMDLGAGNISFRACLDKIDSVVMAATAAIVNKCTAVGAKIGAAVGTVFGPIGTTIGTTVGGLLGKFVGTKAGQWIQKGVQVIKEKAVQVFHTIKEKAKQAVGKVFTRVKDFCKDLIGL